MSFTFPVSRVGHILPITGNYNAKCGKLAKDLHIESSSILEQICLKISEKTDNKPRVNPEEKVKIYQIGTYTLGFPQIYFSDGNFNISLRNSIVVGVLDIKPQIWSRIALIPNKNKKSTKLSLEGTIDFYMRARELSEVLNEEIKRTYVEQIRDDSNFYFAGKDIIFKIFACCSNDKNVKEILEDLYAERRTSSEIFKDQSSLVTLDDFFKLIEAVSTDRKEDLKKASFDFRKYLWNEVSGLSSNKPPYDPYNVLFSEYGNGNTKSFVGLGYDCNNNRKVGDSIPSKASRFVLRYYTTAFK